MLGNLLIVLLVLLAPVLGGLLMGEIIYRINAMRLFLAVAKEARETRKADLRAEAVAVSQQVHGRFYPYYVIEDEDGHEVARSMNGNAALKRFVGLLDHRMFRVDGPGERVLVGRNRSMKTEKKAT